MDWQGAVAIGGVVVALATWLTSARKSKVQELIEIINAMSNEIDRLKARIVELERENDELRTDNRALCAQIASSAKVIV